MIARLVALAVLGLVGLTAVSASSGAGSVPQYVQQQTPLRLRTSLQASLAAEHDAAVEAERRRRYQAGEMSTAERAQYELEIERERQRAAAAAAAAREAARLRNLQRQRSGGGYSGGK